MDFRYNDFVLIGQVRVLVYSTQASSRLEQFDFTPTIPLPY